MQLMHACAENMLFLDSTTQSLFGTQENSSNGADPNSAASEEDKVQLMTIHKSKGLEFSVVFLVGMSQGGVSMRPRAGSKSDEYSLQEEAKNMVYVGVTRAKDSLVIPTHHSVSRSARPDMRWLLSQVNPSMFLTAIYKEFEEDVVTTEQLEGSQLYETDPRRIGYPNRSVRSLYTSFEFVTVCFL